MCIICILEHGMSRSLISINIKKKHNVGEWLEVFNKHEFSGSDICVGDRDAALIITVVFV